MRLLILIGLAPVLLPTGACSVYDTDLLQFESDVDAKVAPGQSSGGAGGQVASDAGKRIDAGHTIDAGHHVTDAGAAHNDAGVADGSIIDAAFDASALSDAGCLSAAAPDGIDCCPTNPDKTDPGTCGCDAADVDSDGDGPLDCMDACPNDPGKVAPGTCGCGILDQDADGVASCSAIKSELVHRYRFDGSGTAVTDSVGTSHGTLVNAQLTDTGAVTLAGGDSDQFVDLPNGIVSSLSNATFEAWLTWNGGALWQRIFDFGNPTAGGEGNQGSGRTYLFLTTATVTNGGTVRVAFKRTSTASEIIVNAAGPLATGTLSHVAVVFDDANNLLSLYVNGALAMSTALTGSLSSISDINNWIGRSQYSNDDELGATVQEFRIYKAALSAAQLATSFKAGPDPVFLQP